MVRSILGLGSGYLTTLRCRKIGLLDVTNSMVEVVTASGLYEAYRRDTWCGPLWKSDLQVSEDRFIRCYKLGVEVRTLDQIAGIDYLRCRKIGLIDVTNSMVYVVPSTGGYTLP